MPDRSRRYAVGIGGMGLSASERGYGQRGQMATH